MKKKILLLLVTIMGLSACGANVNKAPVKVGDVKERKINEDGSFVITKEGIKKEFTKKNNIKIHWYSDAFCGDCIRTHQNTKDFIKKSINEGKLEIEYHPLNFLPHKSEIGYSLEAASWIVAVADKNEDKLLDFMDKVYLKETKDRKDNKVFIEIAKSLNIDEKTILDRLDYYKEKVNKGSEGIRENKSLKEKSPKENNKFFVPFIYIEGTDKALQGEEKNTLEYIIKPLEEKINFSQCEEDCN